MKSLFFNVLFPFQVQTGCKFDNQMFKNGDGKTVADHPRGDTCLRQLDLALKVSTLETIYCI